MEKETSEVADTQTQEIESDQEDQQDEALEEEPLKEEQEEKSSEESSGKKGQEEESAEKPSIVKKLLGGKKRLILIAGAVLLLLLLILGGWMMFFSGSDEVEQEPGSSQEQQTASDQAKWKENPVFEDILAVAPFERMVMKQGSAKGFVSMEISLFLSDPADRVEVFSRMDEIRRMVQDNIRRKTWMDLRGPEGKIQCKYELLSGINGLFPRRVLKDLYIINFIML